MQALIFLILIAVAPPQANADSPSSAQVPATPSSVAVTVSGAEVRAKVAENGHDVTLSVGGRGLVHVGLPHSGSVSEIRISRWMSVGVALAIEMHDPETEEVSYYWSTAWVSPQESQVGKPVAGLFLKSNADYDVVGVVNSRSDSIYITLLRHDRSSESESFAGYLYVNNCPVGPQTNGDLRPLAVKSKDGR